MRCVICSGQTEMKAQDVYQCFECQHIYRNFLGNLEDFHRNSYRTQDRFKHSDREKFLRKMYASNLIKKISSFLPQTDNAKIFEVGCGSGHLLESLSKNLNYKYQLAACELDLSVLTTAESINPEVSILNENFLNISKKVLNNIDAVFAIDVLEHILDIDTFLSKCCEVLSKTGKVIIQIPINRSTMFTNPNVNFDGHIHYFSENSIRITFERNNIQVKNIIKTSPRDTANGTEMIVIGERKQ